MPIVTLISILVLAGAVLLLVWAVFTSFPRIACVRVRSFWCPFQDRQVTTELKEDAWNGRLIDVQSCTAFQPPTVVGCDKLCLRLAHFPVWPAAQPRRAEGRLS